MSKPSLSKTLAFRLMFVSILTIFILGSLWVYSVYSHYEEASHNIRESYIAQQKQKIEGVVKSSKRLINAYIIQAQAADGSSSLSDIKADALEQLFHIQYNDDGYVFAASWDGMSLAGPAKGKSVLDAKDVNGVLVVQELIKLSKSGGGYFTYHIPASTGAKPVEKISYVVGIPEWEWYISAGFDLLLLEEQIVELQEKSKKERNLVLLIVSFAIVTLILFIVLSAQVEMRRIKQNFQRFMDFFRSADPENSKIDTDSMGFVEFEEIALAANEMIARRLEVEEALQESQVRLAHHLQNTPLGNVSFDRSFHITEWNMAAEKIFGFSADEIIGKHVAGTLLPPDIGEQVNKIWKLLLENRGGIQSTNENLTKDGSDLLPINRAISKVRIFCKR